MVKGGPTMLAVLAMVLVVLWLLGMVTAYTLGGFVHLFLILALVSFVFHFLRGRRHAV
jgi:hypothetical protein